jgi:hypothetical protein
MLPLVLQQQGLLLLDGPCLLAHLPHHHPPQLAEWLVLLPLLPLLFSPWPQAQPRPAEPVQTVALTLALRPLQLGLPVHLPTAQPAPQPLPRLEGLLHC